jgi:hypothetical protein
MREGRTMGVDQRFWRNERKEPLGTKVSERVAATQCERWNGSDRAEAVGKRLPITVDTVWKFLYVRKHAAGKSMISTEVVGCGTDIEQGSRVVEHV